MRILLLIDEPVEEWIQPWDAIEQVRTEGSGIQGCQKNEEQMESLLQMRQDNELIVTQ